jgi:enoyl-CoA hydratase
MADRYGLSTIRTELDDGVLVATLNRPERRNALDTVMHSELPFLYQNLAADDEVLVMVLTGAGKYFTVGADFSVMNENESYPDGHPGLLIEAVATARNILSVRQPMIAAVNGDAIGIGATLALFCDIVYMADHARIGDPHVRAGMVCGDGGAVLWPMLMGANRAKEYLMTGDLVSAQDADRLGLTNHVVPVESLMDEAIAMARRLAAGPQIAIRFNKRLVNKDLEARVVQLYDLAAALEALSIETTDHREAVASFLERRDATFVSGRATAP